MHETYDSPLNSTLWIQWAAQHHHSLQQLGKIHIVPLGKERNSEQGSETSSSMISFIPKVFH